MQKDNDNGRELCELTAQLLAKPQDLSVTDVVVPDCLVRNRKAVDFSCRIGEMRHYFEHTKIEPFEKAIESGKHFDGFAEILERELQDSAALPPGKYMLLFDLAPTAGLHKAKHEALSKEIVVWVQQQLHSSHGSIDKTVENAGNAIDPIRKTIGPAQCCLAGRLPSDWTTNQAGQVLVARARPEDLEELRSERIKTALVRKLPKLLDSGESGDIKVLVLEYCDPALTHVDAVTSALRREIELQPWPDHVFIWNTTMPDCGRVCQPIASRDWIEASVGWVLHTRRS